MLVTCTLVEEGATGSAMVSHLLRDAVQYIPEEDVQSAVPHLQSTAGLFETEPSVLLQNGVAEQVLDTVLKNLRLVQLQIEIPISWIPLFPSKESAWFTLSLTATHASPHSE